MLGQARSEIVHDAAAAELREASGQRELDIDVHRGRTTILFRRQHVIDDTLDPRIALGIARIAANGALAAGRVTFEVGIADERCADRAQLDVELELRLIFRRSLTTC